MKIKRNYLYILFLLISILTLKIVYAEGSISTEDIDIDLVDATTINLGDQYIVINKEPNYKDLSCSIVEASADSPISLNSNSTSYYVEYGAITNSDGKIKVHCSYTNTDTNKATTLDSWFTYQKTSESYYTEKAYRLDAEKPKPIDLYSDLLMTTVQGISFDSNADGILDIDCEDKKCTISLNSGYYQVTEMKLDGSVTYMRTAGSKAVELTTILHIVINSNDVIYAHPDSYGSCGTLDSSIWTKKDSYYIGKQSGISSLPDCTPNDSIYEFVGWSKTKRKGETGAMLPNLCLNYSPQKGSINLESGTHYFPCYKTGGGILVYPTGNELEDPSGWDKRSDGSYYKKGEGTVTLPNLKLDGTFGKDRVFMGWRKKGTSDVIQPGTAVPADGSQYIADFSRTTIYRNYYKTIYVNETYHLTLSETTVTGCVSSNEKYIKATGSGECLLTGLEPTDEYVEVAVMGENDYQKIFYVNAVSRSGMSEAGDEPFIINLDPNVIATVTDSSTLNTYLMDSCELFEFDKAATEAGGSTTDPSGTRIYNYKFKCKKGAATDFISYCLDAGRLSPKNGIEYIKSEQIDMRSDFGKLIGYMAKKGMVTGSMAKVEDVTILIRVVGIIDNIAIASDFNAGDEAHAGSYDYYRKIAEAIVGPDGKIDPAKVAAEPSLSADVKDVLTNYQNEETSESLMFERTVEDIVYSDIAANGDYSVTYKGLMLVPGHGADLQGWQQGGFKGTVVKFELTTDPAKQVDDRQVYEYEVKIEGNINSSTLPIGTNTKNILEATKDYSFKLLISDAAGADAFIIEPTGANASENYQRMLTVNAGGGTTDPGPGGDGIDYSSALTLYVYFSPAPGKEACGKGALDISNPTNPTLFRASGCCNVPAVPQNVLDDICTTTCTSSTTQPVCDYRGTYTGEAEYYEVVEGYKAGTYKIGGAEACIVETRDYGYGASMLTHDTTFNKYDDAGNSLMVDSYKANRYCRVSCREEWGFGLDGYGSFTGENAVAAGSYFQLNKSDLFISGKRTCYTTFLNYGNTNTSREIGAGDSGFTKDVSDESDKIVNAYNGYSNLSHVYADLACENDEEYTTSGGHTVKCDYSDINSYGYKFCSSYHTERYCYTGEPTDGECQFTRDAFAGSYCDSGDTMDESTGSCTHTYTASSTTNYDYTKTKAKDATTGECPSSYKWTYDPSDTTQTYKCYYYTKSYSCNGTDTKSGTTCTHTYTKTAYACESADLESITDIPEEYLTRFKRALSSSTSGWDDPSGSLYVVLKKDDVMKHADDEAYVGQSILHESTEYIYDDGFSSVQSIAHQYRANLELKENNANTSDHNCLYRYDIRSANICDSWSMCITYFMGTTNQVDDGDKTPENEETGPGQYVHYQLDTVDGKLNSNTKPVGELTSYTTSPQIRTGQIELYDKTAFTGYAYHTIDEAKIDAADDRGFAIGATAAPGRSAISCGKYRITKDESIFCHGGSYSLGTDGLSYSAGGFEESTPGGLATGGTNVMIRDLGYNDICTKSMPNCYIKQGSDEKVSSTIGNTFPSRFGTVGGSGTLDQEQDDSNTGCATGSSCDTERAQIVRQTMLEGLGIKPKLTGYAQAMIAANGQIIKYAKDFYACQHFEMYNASDGQDNDRKNNSLWASNFMGTTRPFVRIVSNYEPEISYTYDEREYMTLLGSDNVMERFDELNNSIQAGFGCYNMTDRSGNLDCYKNTTNQTREVNRNGTTYNLSRNYTENTYFNTKNKAWEDDVGAKYGKDSSTPQVTLSCRDGEVDCNIGEIINQIDDAESGDAPQSFYKRTILCSIGLTNDEPITVHTGDMKSSGLTSIYVNDKDFFWTAGTCFINQVQYIKANYVSASIENSSFFKNKGYWYLNDGTDIKAHGENLINALTNSNELVKSKYNVNDKEVTGQWSVIGDYNVFPLKMTTPRDLYEYIYTFSNIGSYGDGKTGRIMGNDQSLIAVNSRTCFYEVFEEICLCCGNPINAHTDLTELVDIIGDMYSFSQETEPHSSTLTITTSTVSLSDMNSDGNRELGNNWGEESLFFYNGDTFTTTKGAELLREIQAEGRGENIYTEIPEYEFVINPNGMSEIRQWNEQHGYQINFNTNNIDGSIVVPESRYAIMPYDSTTYITCDSLNDTGCKWDVPASTDEDDFAQNRIINFTHYKSKFLEDKLKNTTGVTFVGRYSDYNIGMSEDCYVKTDKVDEVHAKAESCRWVDYVQTEQITENGTTKDRYYRLAFK